MDVVFVISACRNFRPAMAKFFAQGVMRIA